MVAVGLVTYQPSSPSGCSGASTSAAGGRGRFLYLHLDGGEASPAVPASLTARKR